MRRNRLASAVCLGVLVGGCAAAPIHVASLDELERVRATASAREGAARAPEVAARAEQERAIAQAAHAAGDDVAATLHADRAIAAYGHALVIARLAVAMTERADAQKALDDAAIEEQKLETSRAELEREASDLAERARLAREVQLPATSSPAPPDREAARLSAARSIAIEARLFCGAAHLIAPGATDLASAQDALARLDTELDPPRGARREPGAVIDDAGAVRARCLDVLTRARRAGADDDGRADDLLAELSASGGWAPVRDERGVVVTLRGAFRGGELTADGEAKLTVLGRVAAAHPGFAVQVVVHDAEAHVPADADARRAAAAVKALVAAGTPAARIESELAGAHAPIVDPSDAAFRARNERVEVVFVAGG